MEIEFQLYLTILIGVIICGGIWCIINWPYKPHEPINKKPKVSSYKINLISKLNKLVYELDNLDSTILRNNQAQTWLEIKTGSGDNKSERCEFLSISTETYDKIETIISEYLLSELK